MHKFISLSFIPLPKGQNRKPWPFKGHTFDRMMLLDNIIPIGYNETE